MQNPEGQKDDGSMDSIKRGLAKMLKGGVIMDVVSVEQARIAAEAGACAVMALERVPSDIRKEGGIARMADPHLILDIKEAVSIPVMAKCRIGHFVEANILESLKVDFIDESEVLTPSGEMHIAKATYKVPFVCGCRNLGEALRRIGEGAAMIRTKGDAGTGNVYQAVRHLRLLREEINALSNMDEKQIENYAAKEKVSIGIVKETREVGRLPVVTFAAGGVATPADAALLMHLGADGIFVGSGIFKSGSPAMRAKAIVTATVNYKDSAILAQCSNALGKEMH